MNWRLKGAIQKMLGRVPAGERIHYELQRRGGGLRNFDKELEAKVEDWRLMVGHLASVGRPVAGAQMLEMGSGWYPTFPIGLFLGGVKSVITVDLNRYLKPELMARMVEGLGRFLPVIVEATGRKADDVDAAYRELRGAIRRGASIEDATGGVVTYQAPADAADTRLPAASLDVVFSNSVLEHVPGPVIEACFVEARRILRPGGVVFHSVNCGDHYAYADRRIHQLNYLQFSEADWAKWNNEFLYQNRLRAVDFTDMAKRAGFTIEVDTSRPHPTRLEQLSQIRVHPEFARYSRDQLAITSIDFVARNP